MLSQGIIEHIQSSPWVSNLVSNMVKQWENLVVYRLAKYKAVILGKYPVPTVEELSSRVQGCYIYSKLDLCSGYIQLTLVKTAQNLMAFVMVDGLFWHTHVPFRLSSAPVAFQGLLLKVLAGLPGCINLMDDILVFGKDMEHHNQCFWGVLEQLWAHGLTLNIAKCSFGLKEVVMYGLWLNAYGVQPLESNIQAVMDIPEPMNLKELTSFLAMANWHLQFVQPK